MAGRRAILALIDQRGQRQCIDARRCLVDVLPVYRVIGRRCSEPWRARRNQLPAALLGMRLLGLAQRISSAMYKIDQPGLRRRLFVYTGAQHCSQSGHFHRRGVQRKMWRGNAYVIHVHKNVLVRNTVKPWRHRTRCRSGNAQHAGHCARLRITRVRRATGKAACESRVQHRPCRPLRHAG